LYFFNRYHSTTFLPSSSCHRQHHLFFELISSTIPTFTCQHIYRSSSPMSKIIIMTTHTDQLSYNDNRFFFLTRCFRLQSLAESHRQLYTKLPVSILRPSAMDEARGKLEQDLVEGVAMCRQSVDQCNACLEDVSFTLLPSQVHWLFSSSSPSPILNV
jgi:hypothetical protein